MKRAIDALNAGVNWLLERFERLAVYGGSDEYRTKMKDLGYGQKE